MMKRIGILMFCIIVAISAALAQRAITIYSADSAMTATTFINRSEAVDSIFLRGMQTDLVYRKLPLPKDIECTPVANLISACASLNLPILSTITRISDSLVVYKGIFPGGAMIMKHILLVNPHSGKLIDWLAFISNRGQFNIAFTYLEAEGRLLLSRDENQIYNDLIYRVNQPEQYFTPIPMLSKAIQYFSSGIEAPLGKRNPVLRKDFFSVQLMK